MPRRTHTEEQTRQTLLDAASQIAGNGPGELFVIVGKGTVEIVRPAPPIAGQVPEGMNPYDARILAAITDSPASASRLAHRAGHRHNSYFRQRLARLVEAGFVRHTRRGYARPGG